MGKKATNTPMQQRIQEQRRTQEAADRRMKIIMGAAIGVIVLVAAIIIGVMVVNQKNAGGDGQSPTSGVGAEAAAKYAGGKPVVIGNGGPVVDLYFDYSCPHCAEIDALAGPPLMKAVEAGKATVNLRPVNTQNFPYHHAATGALLRTATAEPAKVQALHEALLHDYLEGASKDGIKKFQDPTQSLQEVLAVAKKVGVADATLAGLTVTEADKYLTEASQAWSAAKIEGVENGQLGTPMFVRDGKVVKIAPPQFKQGEQGDAMKVLEEYFAGDFLNQLTK